MLIVPRKRIWTQQPQQGVEIDSGNPLAKGVVFYAPLSGHTSELVSGVAGQAINGAGFAVTTTGRSALFDGTNDCITFPAAKLPLGNKFSFSSWITIKGSMTSRQTLFGSENTSGGFMLEVGAVYPDGTATMIASFNGAPQPDKAKNGLFTLNTRTHIGYVRHGVGTPSDFYVNGTKVLTVYSLTSDFTDVLTVHSIGRRASGSQPFNGLADDVTLWNRELSADEIRSVFSNSSLLKAPDIRIFVPTGAGAGGGDILTASSIIASPATVGSPPLSQKHALSASSIATAAATLSAPAVAQNHALTASAISTSPATLSSPAISGDTYNLVGVAISTAAPTLSAPALSQNHALTGGAIAAGSPTFGTPTLAQQHALMADGITTGAVTLSSPELTEGGALPFTQAQIDYLEANYVTLANINDIAAAVLAAMSPITQILRNKMVTDPVSGTITVYADDGVTPALSADIFEDAAGTQPYRGRGAERRERLE